MDKQKAEQGIKTTQDLTIRMMEFLLTQKEKKLSYADVASFLAKSITEFQKDSSDPSSPFNKIKLEGKTPELIYNMTVFSCFTKLLGDLLCYCSPEEAKKITDLLPKKN